MENLSAGDGIYWALTTMTTVGYGDITPKTTEGKVIAVVVMLVGIGFAALVIGAIADRFVHPRAHRPEKLADDELVKQVEEISARLRQLEGALRQRVHY